MLKHLHKKLGVAAICAAAALSAAHVHAATASATASIFGIDGSTLLSFSNDQYLSDISTPLHSSFNTGSTLGSYYFNDTPSFASIDNSFAPAPQTTAGATGNGSGAATVLWSFDWIATGTGVATFDLDYLYSATVSGWQTGETGIASASISAVLEGTQNKQDVLYYFNNINGNTFGNEHLLLNFDVVEGQTGSITVTAASNALATPAVPVPAAIWLMGSALLGLGGIARRRR